MYLLRILSRHHVRFECRPRMDSGAMAFLVDQALALRVSFFVAVAGFGSGAASSAATCENLASNHFSMTAFWGAGTTLCQLKLPLR